MPAHARARGMGGPPPGTDFNLHSGLVQLKYDDGLEVTSGIVGNVEMTGSGRCEGYVLLDGERVDVRGTMALTVIALQSVEGSKFDLRVTARLQDLPEGCMLAKGEFVRWNGHFDVIKDGCKGSGDAVLFSYRITKQNFHILAA